MSCDVSSYDVCELALIMTLFCGYFVAILGLCLGPVLSPFSSLFEAPNHQLGKVKKGSIYWEKETFRGQQEVISTPIFPSKTAQLTHYLTPKTISNL